MELKRQVIRTYDKSRTLNDGICLTMSATIRQFQINDELKTNSLIFFNGVRSPGAFTFESGMTTLVNVFMSLLMVKKESSF